MLSRLNKWVAPESGPPVIGAEAPLTYVERGGGRALDMLAEPTMDLLSSN
ncbi:hypothetical protein [Pseudomonas syringae]